MLERNGKIFTTVMDDISAGSLMEAIQKHSVKGSVFYTDQFRSYKSLRFYGRHLTVDLKAYKCTGGVLDFAKERFLKYHGVGGNHFYLYLKEMEFRYNYRKNNLFELLTYIHFSHKTT